MFAMTRLAGLSYSALAATRLSAVIAPRKRVGERRGARPDPIYGQTAAPRKRVVGAASHDRGGSRMAALRAIMEKMAPS